MGEIIQWGLSIKEIQSFRNISAGFNSDIDVNFCPEKEYSYFSNVWINGEGSKIHASNNNM